jgi:hypothetical protein
MKRLLITCYIVSISLTAFCQQSDQDAAKQTVNTLFDAMRKGDTVSLRSVFDKGMMLQSISAKADGSVLVSTETADAFVKAIGAPHQAVYDERITFNDIKTDGSLASVWAPYKFYLGTQFSHCGVDVFQLVKYPDGWKIIYIVDTRRKDNCPG